MLEFLGDTQEIAGQKIQRQKWKKLPGDLDIQVNEEGNSITFNLQKGSRCENGHNGIQIEQALEVLVHLMDQANKKKPKELRTLAIQKLKEGIFWSKERFTNSCDYNHKD